MTGATGTAENSLRRPSRWRGIRARTTVAATLVVALAFIIGGVVLTLALRDSLHDAAEDAAENRADELVDALEEGSLALDGSSSRDRGDSGGDRGEDADDDADDDRDLDDLAWQIVSGETLLASSGTDGYALPTRDDVVRVDGDRFVVITDDAELPDGTQVRVSVASSLEEADDSVAALVPLLALGLPLATVIVAATTWVVVGRTLRPVEAIRGEVAVLGAHALDRRVPVPASGDEIARLAVTMNQMLERLDVSAQRQQQFVSDTSHELRSPLASLRQTAEVARSHPDAIEREEVVEAVLEETARMQHLVEQMLVLTRTEEGAAHRRRSEVDLDDLLLGEARRIRRERSDLEVDTSGVDAVRVLADAPALARVVRNLADNAVRHTGSRIVLRSQLDGSAAVITVADDGAGVAAADRERVFERFVRLDEARSRDAGGSGLGLAIVREVAAAHGGHAEVVAAPGSGAEFVVRLPAEPGSPA